MPTQRTTMSAAESAAHVALQSALVAASTFFEGKGALALLTTPGLLDEDLTQAVFAALEVPQQESVSAAKEDSDAAAKPKPKQLGSLPVPLQVLFASACHLNDLTNTAVEAYNRLGREHTRRHGHFLVDKYVDGSGDDAGHTDEDPGCKAVAEGREAIGKLRAKVEACFRVFWDLVKDLYPDAGKIGVTSARTLVETAPKPEAGSMPPGLAALLASRLAGMMEVRLGVDSDDDGDDDVPGDILSGLFDGLLRHRSNSAGSN